MRIRRAVPDDAPALGRVMVESWLAAHRGQVPDTLWHKRLQEWTPDVSGQAWARTLADIDHGQRRREVLLVADADPDGPVALVLGTEADTDTPGSTAEIRAIYVRPDRQGHGIGRLLLGSASTELDALGFTTLHIGVLTANLSARGFYAAMGGQEIGRRTFEEEGYQLPGTVYAWTDLADLASDARGRS